MASIVPILATIILRIPLAISAMFMILISCIFNFIPAIALAKEKSEIPLLSQKPKVDVHSNKIISFKLVFCSFLFTGMIASSAGFISFYTAMNSFGFPVLSLFGMAKIKGFYVDKHRIEESGYDEDVLK